MSMYLIVTKPDGLYVFHEMNLVSHSYRVIPFDTGFTAYKFFSKSATQVWVLLTDPSTPSQVQEYTYISLASKRYADMHPDQPEVVTVSAQYLLEQYQYMLMHGYTGSPPF